MAAVGFNNLVLRDWFFYNFVVVKISGYSRLGGSKFLNHNRVLVFSFSIVM